jgi:hypothetical protein
MMASSFSPRFVLRCTDTAIWPPSVSLPRYASRRLHDRHEMLHPIPSEHIRLSWGCYIFFFAGLHTTLGTIVMLATFWVNHQLCLALLLLHQMLQQTRCKANVLLSCHATIVTCSALCTSTHLLMQLHDSHEPYLPNSSPASPSRVIDYEDSSLTRHF